MDINIFKKTPFLGILRGIKEDALESVLDAVILSGLRSIEITMNTKNAADLIRRAVRTCGKQLMIGAGTVLDLDTLKQAQNAGATFMVSPVLVENLVSYCTKNKIPVFPGALTPQEVYNAWNAGATMVKVFPAKFFGPAYFKELKAPLKDLKLLACGGVSPDNIKEYFLAGADAVAFGASAFRKDWIAKKDFLSMEQYLKKILSCAL
ncbi:MAG: bifunctional 4-hydroxy-2-oxoglutarate aldolase/2-dehydro-3-deoxy-phosphogluconate aldolase [Candidatus Omnitrophota bacterium]